MTTPLRPVTLAECGTNDRWLYAAALLMVALVAAVGYAILRVAK